MVGLSRYTRWLAAAATSLGLGCGAGDGGATDAGGDSSSGGMGKDPLHCSEAFDDEGDAWLELGQGAVEYEPLAAGGELRIVLGGQGLLMFAIDMRAGGFCVPADLSDRDEYPILDIELDVEGEASPFIELYDQPIDFEIRDDDTYVWVYLPLVLPDAVDPEQLIGREVTVDAHLEPYDHEPLDVEMQLVVGVEK